MVTRVSKHVKQADQNSVRVIKFINKSNMKH